jgi:hypothetical protein
LNINQKKEKTKTSRAESDDGPLAQCWAWPAAAVRGPLPYWAELAGGLQATLGPSAGPSAHGARAHGDGTARGVAALVHGGGAGALWLELTALQRGLDGVGTCAGVNGGVRRGGRQCEATAERCAYSR